MDDDLTSGGSGICLNLFSPFSIPNDPSYYLIRRWWIRGIRSADLFGWKQECREKPYPHFFEVSVSRNQDQVSLTVPVLSLSVVTLV